LLSNSPLPANVAAEIENAPIDDNLKALLLINQNGMNAREIKEMQIADLEQSRSLVVNSMLRTYWADDATEDTRTELKNFLISDNNILSQQHLFDIYFNENNYDAARSCLAKIEELAYICDMDYISEIENNNQVLNLMIDIEQGNISLEDAVSQNKDLLTTMKSENGVAGSVYAAILLDNAGIEPMHEVIRLPEPAVNQKNAFVSNNNSVVKADYSDMVNIYPNPSSDFVYVEYLLTDISKYMAVNVYTITGNLVKSYPVNQKAGYIKIEVSGLLSGTYIVSFGENDSKFSKQIVVE
jgi:tetratricopeptide (TPR) repeat protein